MKTREEIEWIREQVYDSSDDVTYTTQPYAGASGVRYSWEYVGEEHAPSKGIAIIYGINREHAEQLFHKWNRASSEWKYQYLEDLSNVL